MITYDTRCASGVSEWNSQLALFCADVLGILPPSYLVRCCSRKATTELRVVVFALLLSWQAAVFMQPKASYDVLPSGARHKLAPLAALYDVARCIPDPRGEEEEEGERL